MSIIELYASKIAKFYTVLSPSQTLFQDHGLFSMEAKISLGKK